MSQSRKSRHQRLKAKEQARKERKVEHEAPPMRRFDWIVGAALLLAGLILVCVEVMS